MTPQAPAKGGLFRQYIRDTYEAAASAFAADPSANNWFDLKVAMWAWQHVQAMSHEVAVDAAHEFVLRVAEHAKGDSNFGEGQ